jgi:hypothetical protein
MSGIFKNLSDNFSTITNKMFGWQMGLDPAVAAQQAFAQQRIEPSVNNVLLTKFLEISDTKRGIIEDIDSIKNFYFSQLIVDRILDDSLNPTGNEHQLFEVRVKNSLGEIDETASKLANDFMDEFNIQKMIVDVASDLLYYGEYFLRLDVNGQGQEDSSKQGIITIHDDVDMTSVIPVFRDSDVSYFLKLGEKKIETVQPTELIYFSLPSSRIRVKVDGLNDKVLYLRMGKSVLYPIYGLLKELKFLENLVPLGFINDAMATKLVSVSVPATTKPSEAQKIAQTFEKMINKTLRVGTSQKSDEEILKTVGARVGEVKVIPNFGDKGELQSEDFNSENNYDEMHEKIIDIRKMALTTIGVPASIIDEEGIKADIIKDHIRYTKKLKSIQFALKEGLQRLLIVHLTNIGFRNYLKEDIDVVFLNILNTDDLEKLEFLDLTVSMVDNFKSFISDFEDHDEIAINMDEYVKFLNKQFSTMAGFDILQLKETEGADDEDGDTAGRW